MRRIQHQATMILLASAIASLAGCEGTVSGGSTSTAGSGGAPPETCDLRPDCALDPECLGETHNAGATVFGLRVSALRPSRPASFTNGLVAHVVDDSVAPQGAACNLIGGDTTVWLLRFDTGAGTLTFGGGEKPEKAGGQYTFTHADVEQSGQTFTVAPITSPLTMDDEGVLSVAEGQDVVLPFAFGPKAEYTPVLPLHALRVASARLSDSHDCIGRYRVEALDPAEDCIGSFANPTFATAGRMEGFMVLEEADGLEIPELGMSVCTLITGDAYAWGDHALPMARCRREGGEIAFAGDWCSITNAPADSSCHDAVFFSADFAARAVKIAGE